MASFELKKIVIWKLVHGASPIYKGGLHRAPEYVARSILNIYVPIVWMIVHFYISLYPGKESSYAFKR